MSGVGLINISIDVQRAYSATKLISPRGRSMFGVLFRSFAAGSHSEIGEFPRGKCRHSEALWRLPLAPG